MSNAGSYIFTDPYQRDLEVHFMESDLAYVAQKNKGY